MADYDKEAVSAKEAGPVTTTDPAEVPRPSGWMYKSRKIGPWNVPWYASPRVQLGMVAFVCFLCPGMFNALSGLGGGGKTDVTLADDMVCWREIPKKKKTPVLTSVAC